MMNFLSGVFWLLFWIALILGFIALIYYNKLQRLAQPVKEPTSNIQIAISKKLTLINQLIDVVKNFQASEQFTYLKINQDSTDTGLIAAYQQSGVVMSSLQGMAQRFPDLKASEQYHRLIDSIQHCENDIQNKRQTYNAAAREYNKVCLSIPAVFVARFMGFSKAPYLEFDTSGVQDVTSLKEFKTDDGERLQQLLSGAGSKVANVSRMIAGQAGQAGRLLTDSVKEQIKDRTMPVFFYVEAGSVPKGPHSMEKIRELTAQSGAGHVSIAEPGSDNWRPLPPA